MDGGAGQARGRRGRSGNGVRRRAALVALVVAYSSAMGSVGCVPPGGSCAETPPGLRAAASGSDIEIGTAYRKAYADADNCYRPVAVREFNSLTPEIATFPNRILAAPGRYDFTEADAICDLAEDHDMACQGHSLLWDPIDHPEWRIVPDWVRNQTPAQRRTTMVDYVTATVTHFRGRVDAYTLVNEAFDGQGNLTGGLWSTTGDDSWIFDAFRAARRADPEAELFYNDWGGEDVNAKSDAILALAQRLRAETVPVAVDGVMRDLPLIDGIGMQMHVGVGPGQAPSPASVAQNMDRMAAAGLEVRITELDVRVPVSPEGVATTADLDRQATLYRQYVDLCVDAPNCDHVTLWGFTDAHSWITENAGSFPGQGAAHPYDSAYRPKRAHSALAEALAAP
jgi:endo-1,4-beta-xylanase